MILSLIIINSHSLSLLFENGCILKDFPSIIKEAVWIFDICIIESSFIFVLILQTYNSLCFRKRVEFDIRHKQ